MVYEDYMVALALKHTQALSAALCSIHLNSYRIQQLFYIGQIGRHIIDNQHLCLGCSEALFVFFVVFPSLAQSRHYIPHRRPVMDSLRDFYSKG